MKQQRHQASVTAFFDMLRLRKLPTCIKVGRTIGLQRPHVKPETLLLIPGTNFQWLRIVLLRFRGVNIFIRTS